jgi:hypothetical protein
VAYAIDVQGPLAAIGGAASPCEMASIILVVPVTLLAPVTPLAPVTRLVSITLLVFVVASRAVIVISFTIFLAVLARVPIDRAS